MLRSILTVAALALALMIVIKDGRLLRDVGLTAECTVVQRAVDGTELAGCRAGKLEGFPDLTKRSCVDAGVVGYTEYWRCPAATSDSLRP